MQYTMSIVSNFDPNRLFQNKIATLKNNLIGAELGAELGAEQMAYSWAYSPEIERPIEFSSERPRPLTVQRIGS